MNSAEETDRPKSLFIFGVDIPRIELCEVNKGLNYTYMEIYAPHPELRWFPPYLY